MDNVDIANDYAEKHLEYILAQRATHEKNEVSLFYCIECDEVIPHKRRAAITGVETCVDCQEIIERRSL